MLAYFVHMSYSQITFIYIERITLFLHVTCRPRCFSQLRIDYFLNLVKDRTCVCFIHFDLVPKSVCKIKVVISSVGITVLRQSLLPPSLLPAPCSIRGACLGKYQRREYEKNGNGLTFMILNDEYFSIFFTRILRVKGYYGVIPPKTILELLMVCRV